MSDAQITFEATLTGEEQIAADLAAAINQGVTKGAAAFLKKAGGGARGSSFANQLFGGRETEARLRQMMRQINALGDAVKKVKLDPNLGVAAVRSLDRLGNMVDGIATDMKGATASTNQFKAAMTDVRAETQILSRVTDQAAARQAQASRERISQERTAQAQIKAAASQSIVATQAANSRALAETRRSAQQRVAVIQAMARSITAIERGLSSAFTGTARIMSSAFRGIGTSVSSVMSGLVSRVRGSSRQMDAALSSGLSSSLSRRESILRSSFRRQESALTSSINRQSATIQRFETVLSRGVLGAATGRSAAASGLGLGGIGAAIGGGALGTSLLTSGFQRFSDIERLNKQFLALTGSATDTALLMQQIKAFSKTTSFDLVGVADLAKGFLTIGTATEEVLPRVRLIADAVALTGGGTDALNRIQRAITQVVSAGRLQGDEINQLAENLPGLNIRQILADQLTGGDVGALVQMQEAGEISADMFLSGLLGGLQSDTRLTGAAEALASTLSGRFANLKESFSDLGATLIGLVADPLKSAFATLNDVFGTLGGFIRGENLSAPLETLRTALGGMVTALAGLVAVRGAVQILQLLGAAAAALLSPMGLLIGIVAAVGAAFAVLKDSSPAFNIALRRMGEILGEIGSTLADVGRAFLDIFSGVAEGLGTSINEIGGAIGVFLLQRLRDLAGFLRETVAPALIAFAGFLKENIPKALEAIGGFIQSSVIPAFQAFIGFITGTAVPAIVDFAKNIASFAVDAFGTFLDVVNTVGDAITGFIGPALDPMIAGFKALGEAVGDNALIAGLSAIGGALAGFAVGGPIGAIIGSLAALGVALSATGTDMGEFFGSIIEGIEGLAGRVGSAIADFVSSINFGNVFETAIREILDFVQRAGELIGRVFTSPQFLAGVAGLAGAVVVIGARFVQGLILGISQNLPKLYDLMKQGFRLAGEAALTGLKTVFSNPGLLAGLVGGLLVGGAFLSAWRAGGVRAGQAMGDGVLSGFRARAFSGAFAGGGTGSIGGAAGAFFEPLLRGAQPVATRAAQRLVTTFNQAVQNAQRTARLTGGTFDLGRNALTRSLPELTQAANQAAERMAAPFGPSGILALKIREGIANSVKGIGSAVGGIGRAFGSVAKGIANSLGNAMSSALGAMSLRPATEFGQKTGQGLISGLRTALSNVRQGLEPLRAALSQFASDVGGARQAGLAIGKAMVAGIAGGIAGFTTGRAIAESGGSLFDSALGVGGMAAALGTISGPAGIAAGALGAVGVAIGTLNANAAKSKQEIGEYADALRGLAADAQTTATVTTFLENLRDESDGVRKILVEGGFEADTFFTKIRDGSTTASSTFIDVIGNMGGAATAFARQLREDGVDSMSELSEAIDGSELGSQFIDQLHAMGLSTEDVRDLFGLLNDESSELQSALALLSEEEAISPNVSENAQAATEALNNVTTAAERARLAMQIPVAGNFLGDFKIDTLSSLIPGNVAGGAIGAAIQKSSELQGAADKARQALEAMFSAGSYQNTLQAAIDQLIVDIQRIPGALGELDLDLSGTINSSLERASFNIEVGGFADKVKTAMAVGMQEALKNGDVFGPAEAGLIRDTMLSELEALFARDGTIDPIEVEFLANARAQIDELLLDPNFITRLKELFPALFPEGTEVPVSVKPKVSIEHDEGAAARLLASVKSMLGFSETPFSSGGGIQGGPRVSLRGVGSGGGGIPIPVTVNPVVTVGEVTGDVLGQIRAKITGGFSGGDKRIEKAGSSIPFPVTITPQVTVGPVNTNVLAAIRGQIFGASLIPGVGGTFGNTIPFPVTINPQITVGPVNTNVLAEIRARIFGGSIIPGAGVALGNVITFPVTINPQVTIGNVGGAAEAGAAVIRAVTGAIVAGTSAVSAAMSGVVAAIATAAGPASSAGLAVGTAAGTGMAGGVGSAQVSASQINGAFIGAIVASIGSASSAGSALGAAAGAAMSAGVGPANVNGAATAGAFTSGIIGGTGAAVQAARAMAAAASAAATPNTSALYSHGRNMGQSLASGINSSVGAVREAAGALAAAAATAVAARALIGSPSRVFMDFGLDMGAGLSIGLQQSQFGIAAAATSAAAAADNAFANRLGISSPSRVFWDHGRMMMVGVQQGWIEQLRRDGYPFEDIADKAISVFGGAAGRIAKASRVFWMNFKANTNIIGNLTKAAKMGLDKSVDPLNWGQIAAQLKLKNILAKMRAAGINVGAAFAAGLNSRNEAVRAAAINAARQLDIQVRRVLGIRSPSKVFLDIGVLTAEGFRVGFKSQWNKVIFDMTGHLATATDPQNWLGWQAFLGLTGGTPKDPWNWLGISQKLKGAAGELTGWDKIIFEKTGITKTATDPQNWLGWQAFLAMTGGTPSDPWNWKGIAAKLINDKRILIRSFSNLNAFFDVGKTFGEAFAEGLASSEGSMIKAAESAIGALTDATNEALGRWRGTVAAGMFELRDSVREGQTTMTSFFLKGFADLSDIGTELREAIRQTATDIFEATKKKSSERSPSEQALVGQRLESLDIFTVSGARNVSTFIELGERIKSFGLEGLRAGRSLKDVINDMTIFTDRLVAGAKAAGLDMVQVNNLLDTLGLSSQALADFAKAVAEAEKAATDAANAQKQGASVVSIDRIEIHAPYGDPEAIALATANKLASSLSIA